MRNPVFILGLFDTGYYAARLLIDKQITIYGFDYDLNNPGFFSKHIKSFIIPHPDIDPEKLFMILEEKGSEFDNSPILVPTSESYISFVHLYRNDLKKHFKFLLPSKEVTEGILNKVGQFEMAERLLIKVPSYIVVNKLPEIDDLSNSLNYPVIIKGVDQVAWKSRINEKAFILTCKEEFTSISQKLAIKGLPFIVQELIQGELNNNFEYNALMVNGKIIEYSIVQKLYQYPLGYGAACCVKSTINKEIELLGSKFIISNQIEGFSNTEFKYDPKTGIYYFIETNARVWLQIEMTSKLGQNIMYRYYDQLAHNNMIIGNVSKKKYEKIWLDLPPFLILLFRHWKKLNVSRFGLILTIFKASYFGLISLSDPFPFLKTVLFKKRRKLCV